MRIPLIAKMFLAAVIGIALGLVLPALGMRVLSTAQGLISQYIKFLVPLIILGFVIPAIADTGKGAGRALLLTMGIALVSTLSAGFLSYGAASAVFPSILKGTSLAAEEGVRAFPAYFSLTIPPPVDVVTALVLAFIIGLGIVATKADGLSRVCVQFRSIVEWSLAKTLVPVLPFYIMTVIADLTASGRLTAVCGSAVKLVLCCLAINVVILILQYAIAGLVAGRNPLKTLVTMLPAYLTGWGTCSSAATIPVTLRQTKKNGVSEETANLVIPLCANVHLAGSLANVVAYSVGILVIFGDPLSLGAFAHFIFMMSVVAVASPGVPGGCVLAAGAFVDSILGFTPEQYALMVAIYMAFDGMGTACNLTGDGAVAVIVDRFVAKR